MLYLTPRFSNHLAERQKPGLHYADDCQPESQAGMHGEMVEFHGGRFKRGRIRGGLVSLRLDIHRRRNSIVEKIGHQVVEVRLRHQVRNVSGHG